jgi:hypothetical protein
MSPIEEAIEQVIEAQKDKGLKKYGVSLDDANLDMDTLLHHLQQELVDALFYVTALRLKYHRGMLRLLKAVEGEEEN